VQRAPGIPCALCFLGEWILQNSGASRAECGVLARHSGRCQRVRAKRGPMTGSASYPESRDSRCAIAHLGSGAHAPSRNDDCRTDPAAGNDGNFEFKNSKRSNIIAFRAVSNYGAVSFYSRRLGQKCRNQACRGLKRGSGRISPAMSSLIGSIAAATPPTHRSTRSCRPAWWCRAAPTRHCGRWRSAAKKAASSRPRGGGRRNAARPSMTVSSSIFPST